ncbi:MAG: hypothetical protein LBN05_05655 [Oscillospiraceae bacterium]|jgi:hypothetical protein|nr:hypothetical protein [Oscillospiraceae bacterium]
MTYAKRPHRPRRRADIGRYISDTLHTAVENRRLLLLWGLFAAGMLVGARLSRGEGAVAAQCAALFDVWLDARAAQDFMRVFISALLTAATYQLVAMLLGLSAVGLPLIGCIPLVRGLGMGVLCGILYVTFGLRGLTGNLLLFLPGALVAAFGLLLTCRESMDSAQAFNFAAKNKHFPDDWRGLREHLLRTGLLMIFPALSALLDAAGAGIFGDWL